MQKSYKLDIEKNTEIPGDWYILRVYDKYDNSFVMSTTDSLEAILDEVIYWMKK